MPPAAGHHLDTHPIPMCHITKAIDSFSKSISPSEIQFSRHSVAWTPNQVTFPPYSYPWNCLLNGWVSAKVRSPIMWAPAFVLCSWFSSHKKKYISAGTEMGFFRMHLWGYWKERLPFASPHPTMDCLTTSSQLEHQLHFIFQSSCRKREKKNQSL